MDRKIVTFVLRRLRRLENIPWDATLANKVFLGVSEIRKSFDKYKKIHGLSEWYRHHDFLREQYGVFSTAKSEELGKAMNTNFAHLLHCYSKEELSRLSAKAGTMGNEFLLADLKPPEDPQQENQAQESDEGSDTDESTSGSVDPGQSIQQEEMLSPDETDDVLVRVDNHKPFTQREEEKDLEDIQLGKCSRLGRIYL